MSYLYQDRPQSAITYFLKAKEKSQGDIFYQEINWFLALAYITANQLSDAKFILSAIKFEEWHYKEAQNLLSKMP